MPTQWDRRDLALFVRDAVQHVLDNPDDLSDDAHRNVEPFLGSQLSYDDFHSNVVYMRIPDGSAYRITLIQTQPPMPAARSERELAGALGGEARSGSRGGSGGGGQKGGSRRGNKEGGEEPPEGDRQ